MRKIRPCYHCGKEGRVAQQTLLGGVAFLTCSMCNGKGTVIEEEKIGSAV